MDGIAENRAYQPRGTRTAYFDLGAVGAYPQKIEVRIPECLGDAPWGEILFNNNRTGARVIFHRRGEDMFFGPTKGKYVILRLCRESEYPFVPVYVRVDEGPETRFFVLKARWVGDVITIEIEREPKQIPGFLV